MEATDEKRTGTLSKIKTDLRISHNVLDSDLNDTISSCLADLEIVGIMNPDETDVTILAAIKLYVRAAYTDDTEKAAAYTERYNALKATLMMAEGYGGSS